MIQSTSRKVLDTRRVVIDARTAIGYARRNAGSNATVQFNTVERALSDLARDLAVAAGHLAAKEDDEAPRDVQGG